MSFRRARRPRCPAASSRSTARRGSPSSRARSTRTSGRCANLGFTADPIVDGDDQHRADRSARGLRRHLQHRRTTRRRHADRAGRGCTAFFARGGGYIGAGANGANFLDDRRAQVTGLTAASRTGNGRSGIVYWDNTGGAASPIVGAYPAQRHGDRRSADVVHRGAGDDHRRRPAAAHGLLRRRPVARSMRSRRPRRASAVIAHGTNTADTARLTVFANNPLYRADPEREWPMRSARPPTGSTSNGVREQKPRARGASFLVVGVGDT